MRPHLPLALLLSLAACASDPVPRDAAPDGAADAGGRDAVTVDAPTADASPPTDTGSAPDAGVDVQALPDAGVVDDIPQDVGICVEGSECACPASTFGLQRCNDAGAFASCYCEPDPPTDAGSIDASDVSVADVPHDTGPVDAGPVTYDLDAPHDAPSAVMLMGRACDVGCDGLVCDATAAPSQCYRDAAGVHFSIPTTFRCGSITGLVSAGASGNTVYVEGSGTGTNATTANVSVGSSYAVGGVSYLNLHVQLAAPPSASTAGVTGVPGRTVDPTLGDLWLFGCRN